MKLYTRKSGLLALKPERQEACRKAGVIILELGQPLPKDGLLIADCRPRKHVGGRSPNDPAATKLYIGDVLKPEKTIYFEDFSRALSKALRLAA